MMNATDPLGSIMLSKIYFPPVSQEAVIKNGGMESILITFGF